MVNLFVYGSLAHLALLDIVLGHKLDAGQISAAELPDFATYWVFEQAYPMLAEQAGKSADGLLLQGLSEQDLARLDFYEGGFGYALQDVTVHTTDGVQPAEVYFPEHEPARGAAWVLADWVARWGPMTLHAATEAMGYFGQISAQDLAQRFGAIRRRAASYHSGQTHTGGAARLTRKDVQVIEKRTPYSNFFALQEYDLRHRQFNGDISAPMERAVFISYDAAIVLPYDPVLDCVLLVEQLRLGALARGAAQPWLLEPVAGHVDVGETPEQAARREAVEEAGVHLSKLIPICHAYPSPGDSTAFFHIYLGLCDLTGAGGTIAGLASEHEDIRSHILSYDELMAFVDASAADADTPINGANVLPLITAAYWLAANRNRLRQNT